MSKEEKCVSLIVFSNGAAYIAVKPGNPRLEIDYCPASAEAKSSLIMDRHDVVYSSKTRYVNLVEENIDNMALYPYMAYGGKIFAEVKEAVEMTEDPDGIIPMIIMFHCKI